MKDANQKGGTKWWVLWAFLVLVVSSPTHALTCADIQKGAAFVGTTNIDELAAIAAKNGFTVTPQRRRQATRCLAQGGAPSWRKRTSSSTRTR